ncbi:MAG: group II intron reverse transcriptase/maturase, partial [Gammaproteobacteria bacterium]|nr:group II intron reverse transcriptase/maturase [Gammaproteobacteria bacterium]
SPLLSNLYLHYAFDAWMQRHHPNVPFERYADDSVCHCRSQEHAEILLQELRDRLADCHLELHPDKTRLVYCKDNKRRENHPVTRFDFLGFSFHARTMQDKSGNLFTGFGPGVSRKALKRMNQSIRSLNINRRIQMNLTDIAEMLNPRVRGWIAYYGAFYPEPLKRFLVRLDLRLGSWSRNKYKRLRRHKRRSWTWLKRIRASDPRLFAHWEYLFLKGSG